jgi:vancomycin resistance protein YoaR
VRWGVLTGAVLFALVLVVSIAFAGSAGKLAGGVTIEGIDVGGLTPAQAQALLQRKRDQFANVPVVFSAGTHRWALRPSRLGIRADMAAAVERARDDGGGVWPIRGFKRLGLSLFGDDIVAPTTVWKTALAYKVRAIARVVDRPHRDAALEWRGLRVGVVPGHSGRVLDRDAASKAIVVALASLDRDSVRLPIRNDEEVVTEGDLDAAAEQARVAVSAPVRLTLGQGNWRIPRWRLAKLIDLPHGGTTARNIAGPGADAFFRNLTKRVDRPPRNADFVITSGNHVRVTPARRGIVVDVPKTADRLLAAATSPTDRVAKAVLVTKAPARSTEEARAMGITGLVGGYETIYGGDPNRIHNVQLVARLIDGRLIAPGKEFSFNATTGERTPEKGFRSAPVIINGELGTGIGGGVCQVSTTVFNAAYEAGLEITARSNHGLYISHYPLARDATVNYPDIDLKFVNDTPHWLLLRTFVGSSSLTVALYGSPVHRRVESETTPLVETGEVPERRIADPTLYEGEEVVEQEGAPPRSTSVHRRVYNYRGKLIHDDVWYSSYEAEPREIRYGTKPKPAPEPPPPAPQSGTQENEPKPTQTTTTPTTTTAQSPPPPPAVTPRRRPGVAPRR